MASSSGTKWMLVISLVSIVGIGIGIGIYSTRKQKTVAKVDSGNSSNIIMTRRKTPPPPPSPRDRKMEQVMKGLDADDHKRFLVRKLLANPNFQLEVNPEGSNSTDKFANDVQDIMKRAMWDAITNDLNNGKFEKIFSLVNELKYRLAQLTPNRIDILTQLNEVLDVELMEQQLRNREMKDWDLMPLIYFIVTYIKNLESPARNEETVKWFEDMETRYPNMEKPDVLRELFDFSHMKLDLISIDTTNHYLKTIAPVIAEYGVDFYRKKFDERIAHGAISIEVTKQWASKVKASLGDTKLSVTQAHRKGVLDLILPRCDDNGDESTLDILPETMRDEQDEVTEMRIATRKIWRIAYSILRVRQIIPDASNEMLNEVSVLLSSEFDRVIVSNNGKYTMIAPVSDDVTSQLYVDQVINAIHRYHSVEEQDSAALRTLLEKVFKPSLHDATYILICKRFRTIFDELVSLSEVSQKDIDRLGEQLQSFRLLPLREPIFAIASEIARFCSRDLGIHASLYNSLLS